MFVLPPALSSLGAYRQFIVFRVVPSEKRPGKTDKFPIDWRTGRKHDAHDSAIWLDVATAAAYAEAFGPDYGVGFVFTPEAGLFFLDVDECVRPDGWSPMALELLSRFQGAAVEVSLSGRGLHIVGKGTAPPHPTHRRIKYADQFDLYTDGRFVALTGTSALGDAATDHTAALTALCAQYLQADAGTPTEWTTEPCAEWRGPDDDAILVERALRSGSAASAFGARASFRDLWEANTAVLSVAFPDTERPYDESRADSALAQHLAFWTGKNCERVLRLMQLSALRREKWNREDYIQRTILGVVARQYDVLADKPREEFTGTPPPAGGPQGKPVTGETFLTAAEQLGLFQGCVYICNQHRVLVPGGYLLKPDQFKVMYGGYSFPMDPTNERVVRNAWEAFTESQNFRSPRADGVCFRPDLPPAAIIDDAGMSLANVWWPIETARAEGDPAKFLNHLTKLLPNDDDRAKLLAYLAALVQYPGRKFQWAPLVQGVPGNGKTLLVTALARAIGDRYTHLPNTEDLLAGGAKFTGWLQNKLFIGLEEIYTGDRRNMMEVLKPLITNSRIEIQAKGQDQYTGDNAANFFACSNHKDAVPKTSTERRWGIFFTAQQNFEDLARDGMDNGYMPDLWDWFEGREAYAKQPPGWQIINWYLRSYAIPHALNPAGGMHRAPDTTSTAEAMELSIGTVEQEILEAIGQETPGFAGGWVSSIMLDKLLTRIKAERRVPPSKRREMMADLGYEWHPALEGGRVNNAVQPDGGKPKLYIRKGHILQNLGTPALVGRHYAEAQTRALTQPAAFGS